MLGLNIGVPRPSPSAAYTVRWVLNADASAVAGKNYTWIDSSAWADANKWKDTGFGT